MTAQLIPYLQFRGPAREAMEFYRSVFGGELEIMSFADQGGMGLPEDQQQMVMHSALTAGDVRIYGADTPEPFGEPHVNGAMALTGTDTDTLRGWYEALAEGGTVDVPLEKAPWGDLYGQVKDRFGVDWMFNVADPD